MSAITRTALFLMAAALSPLGCQPAANPLDDQEREGATLLVPMRVKVNPKLVSPKRLAKLTVTISPTITDQKKLEDLADRQVRYFECKDKMALITVDPIYPYSYLYWQRKSWSGGKWTRGERFSAACQNAAGDGGYATVLSTSEISFSIMPPPAEGTWEIIVPLQDLQHGEILDTLRSSTVTVSELIPCGEKNQCLEYNQMCLGDIDGFKCVTYEETLCSLDPPSADCSCGSERYLIQQNRVTCTCGTAACQVVTPCAWKNNGKIALSCDPTWIDDDENTGGTVCFQVANTLEGLGDANDLAVRGVCAFISEDADQNADQRFSCAELNDWAENGPKNICLDYFPNDPWITFDEDHPGTCLKARTHTFNCDPKNLPF